MIRFLTFVFFLSLAQACSYNRAYFEYKEFEDKIPIRTTDWSGEVLGSIRYDAKGAIWEDCTALAKTAVWGMIDRTRAIGGNAIGDIRWLPRDSSSMIPMCKKRWVFFVFPPLLFTPLFMSATVEAKAYRVEPPNKAQVDIIPLPKSHEALTRLVEALVSRF